MQDNTFLSSVFVGLLWCEMGGVVCWASHSEAAAGGKKWIWARPPEAGKGREPRLQKVYFLCGKSVLSFTVHIF